MVAIISNKSADIIVKNKDARSESVDSFSSTIDVASFDLSKLQLDDAAAADDSSTSSPCQFCLKDEEGDSPSKFDIVLPPTGAITQAQRLVREALSSILVLDSVSQPKVRTLLDKYNGHLVDMGKNLLEGLRGAAPSRLAARVGDYNENLFFDMRDIDQDIGSIIRDTKNECELDSSIQRDIDSFETSIRKALQHSNLSYRGSFMQTEATMYQPAHYDYDYPILQNYGSRLFLAFFPLTDEGAFLQLWQDPMKTGRDGEGDDGCHEKEGTVVYIPYGKMFIVPSDTLHGGGFKRGSGGNLRFHLYIEVKENNNAVAKGSSEEEKEIELLHHPMNKYTERRDRRRELCERFVDARGLESLLGKFFDV